MDISDKGLRFITSVEGNVLTMYKDIKGLPTIGCGHLLTTDERVSGYLHIGHDLVPWKDGGITPAESRALLHQDCQVAVAAVNKGVKVELTQDQFDSLVSFTFNCGCGAFADSTLLKRVNVQDFDNVPAAFMMWTRAGSDPHALAGRREKEIKLWKGEL